MTEYIQTEFIQINTTSDQKETLQTIGNALIRRRLAACVQIGGPVKSIYRWQGQVESAEEWICSIKTTSENWSAVERVIRDHHNYDEPQIICLPIILGSASYLQWVRTESQPE